MIVLKNKRRKNSLEMKGLLVNQPLGKKKESIKRLKKYRYYSLKSLRMGKMSPKNRHHRIAAMPACYCTYVACNGNFVDDKTRKRHERFDASQSYHFAQVCRHCDPSPRVSD
jgi:hypothetical protein